MKSLATRLRALSARPRPGCLIGRAGVPFLLLASAGSPLVGQSDGLHPSSHRVHRIAVEPGVSLEVLEWGGEGRPLIFLPGANMNAHYFDAFAPRFTDGFRVLGITRRGHGASSRPDSGYALARLVDDIAAVLDTLAIDRAMLAGHSLAGDELTALAAAHPGRVEGLIYLDAGHDHRTFPRCSLEDDRRADTVEELAEWAFAGRPVDEWVVRSQMRIGEDGRVQGPRASPEAVGRIFAGLPAPEYASVEAPVLAIYVVPHAIGGMLEGSEAPSEECVRTAQRYIYGGIADLVRGVDRAKVVALQETTHHMALVTPDSVESAMRTWLRELDEETGASSDFVQPVQVADPVWEELYRDDLFVVSLDVAHVDPGPEPDTFAVWYRTDRLEMQFEDDRPWNREIIRSLLRCDPVQFKTVRVTVFLDDGPPVAQEGGSMAEAADVEWRDTVPESIDAASMEAACAKVAGRRRAAGLGEGARRGVDPGARTIGAPG